MMENRLAIIELPKKKSYRPGEAYAVLDANGLLTLFRSADNLTAGANQTVTDIAGNTYTGEVFVGVENTDTTTSSAPWYSKRTSIKKVDVADGQTIKPAQTTNWFYRCSNVTELDLDGLDTSNVTNMYGMFFGCSSLTTLDVTNFNTSSVTSMGGMFLGCSSLTSLDLSNFNTSSVKKMGGMFSGCASLASIYANDWFDTLQSCGSYSMFQDCISLVGGNGTTYNSSYTDWQRALIDRPGQVGYFTDPVTRTTSSGNALTTG